MSTLTLSATGLDPLTLSSPFVRRSFEWVSGSHRVVSEEAPGADGEIDTSQLHAAGSVTIGLRLLPTAPFETSLRQLRAFTNGRLRPTLSIVADDESEKIATLSRGTVTTAQERPTHQDAVIQFAVPSGILESAELHEASANASGDTVDGFEFDIEFDLEFPAASPQGSVEVVNAGDRDAYPVLRLFGPWSGESSIINDTYDERLVFDNLSVTAGNYLEIDTRAKTILLNGDSTQTRYQYLVFPDSTWFTLRPGTQRIRFVPTTFTAPAQALILWRDAWS